MFRVIPSGLYDDYNDFIAKSLVELYHMSPEEYASDPRWREPIPRVDTKEGFMFREYHPKFEVFDKPENVQYVIQSLSREKSRLNSL